MLEVSGLECARGDRSLFAGLSFAVRPGELLHVTGRNGSGKTTLLRTLCGLTRPVAGEIRFDGRPVTELGDEYRGRLAFVGHTNGFNGELSPLENLRAHGHLAGQAGPDALSALEQVGLAPYAHFASKILSQGQKRRLALARLLYERRPLWILDEPLTALDASSVALMSGRLVDHLAAGGMIVLTSHQEVSFQSVAVLGINLDS